MGVTFSMYLWGEIQGMLSYQVVYQGTLSPIDPTIFKAKKGTDPDKPSLVEALSSPQSEQCTKSMTEEITNLVKQRTWDVIQKYEVPEGANIIPGTYYFKCNCFPEWVFPRFKTRFCVIEYIQKRLSDVPNNTHAPMLQWSMVRLMLVLTYIMVLKTQSTDFSNAFFQDEIKQPVYLQPPSK